MKQLQQWFTLQHLQFFQKKVYEIQQKFIASWWNLVVLDYLVKKHNQSKNPYILLYEFDSTGINFSFRLKEN